MGKYVDYKPLTLEDIEKVIYEIFYSKHNNKIKYMNTKIEATDIGKVPLNNKEELPVSKLVSVKDDNIELKIKVLDLVLDKINKDGIKINDINFSSILIDNTNKIYDFIKDTKPLPALFDMEQSS